MTLQQMQKARLHYVTSDLDRDQLMEMLEYFNIHGLSINCVAIMQWRSYTGLPRLDPYKAIPEVCSKD